MSTKRVMAIVFTMSLITGSCVAEEFKLSSLGTNFITTGWGDPQVNKSSDGNTLRIGGKSFEHGLGTHASGKAVVLLAGRGERFRAFVGVDDEGGKRGSVQFIIKGDDEILFDSDVMHGGDEAREVDVDVSGVDKLFLVVKDGGDGISHDHANWAEAVIVMKEGSPVLVPDAELIEIAGENTLMVLQVSPKGRLLKGYYGPKLELGDVFKSGLGSQMVLPTIFSDSERQYWQEPALQVKHADGHVWTQLVYKSHEKKTVEPGVKLTKVKLKDPNYEFYVDLCFKTYTKQDIIEQWMEVRNQENGPVVLSRFASAAMPMQAREYWLTHFHGKWAGEMDLYEEKLTPGVKIVDSKLGITSSMATAPHFMISLEEPAKENTGKVLGASLAWSGNYRFAFEVADDRLMALAGMNPFASEYELAKGESFKTPALIYTISDKGKGEVSRRFHRWALEHGIRGGEKVHKTVLNNWEATGFDVNEKRIVDLIDRAGGMGMEIFLLDDGWFGSPEKARILGDWRITPKMLPNGLEPLIEACKENDFDFGIWIEMEMANPGAYILDEHPDWILAEPDREKYRQRGQYVLDMTNPEVQEFAFKWADDLLSKHPKIKYVKWDCNSAFHNPWSEYLGSEKQSHLWIDYIHGLYRVMERVAERHPDVQMMVCSGGGGRVDYGVLRYFDEFWPSDNTNAHRRVKIQWGYSHFFPAKTISAHVTHWGNSDFQFAFAVAMSGRLGMDVDPAKMTDAEKAAAEVAIPLYKERIRPIVQEGDLYRLMSPYDEPRAALNYVSRNKAKAVVFAFQTADDESGESVVVRPKGLDAAAKYRVEEVNLPEGKAGLCPDDGRIITGAELMEKGLRVPMTTNLQSSVVILTAE
ncbi:Alpha-galactosidase [Anaerohalosphaera lusitana]|uniref:alpha-galactosidase n=1 Tax=Anaerohalosphaera lusitana TaxID=1936003 RepID=A0A1U9NJH9_9BACT|nr:alpha-galactosidase [Anaerohalosphaera lusitana]AQT68082.1 Alpha-galactosidase [Anaerohalosphaera lusitana]